MKINLSLIIGLYKKTAIILFFFSIISFITVSFLYSYFKGFSFGIGCFLIFLNVLGIIFIGNFSQHKSNIEKDRLIFSIFLFVGKLLLLLIIIFLLIYFKLIDNIMFLGGLSLGFFIFFIINLIFLPLKIYKLEKNL